MLFSLSWFALDLRSSRLSMLVDNRRKVTTKLDLFNPIWLGYLPNNIIDVTKGPLVTRDYSNSRLEYNLGYILNVAFPKWLTCKRAIVYVCVYPLEVGMSVESCGRKL